MVISGDERTNRVWRNQLEPYSYRVFLFANPAYPMSRSPLLCALLLLSVCSGGSTVIEPPPSPADEFTISLQPDAEDLSSAQALGWSTGSPGADVTLTRSGGGGSQTVRTGATGALTIAKLTAGDYTVDAHRWLSDTERARLAAGDDAIGFVAKAHVRAAAGGGQATVSMPASRRRSLVISEFFNNWTYPTPDAPYYYDAYVEVYNNSDTTIYLDGMILARALASPDNYPNFPCSLYAPKQNDPAGVWVRILEMFPGNGNDYPLPPGGVSVVATDAIQQDWIFALPALK
jgi:hypothetical protein